MLMQILAYKQAESDESWVFQVVVEDLTHTVTVPKEYWERLTQKQIAPEELVRKSFEFLLAREPKESILRKFDLPLIQKYFPEFEEIIKPT